MRLFSFFLIRKQIRKQFLCYSLYFRFIITSKTSLSDALAYAFSDISSLLCPISFFVTAGLTPLAYRSAEKDFLSRRAYTLIPHFLLTFASKN